MGTEALERAFGVARGVLANVTADQYGNSTPCVSWDVQRLLTHMVASTYWYASSVETGSSPQDSGEDKDYTSGDVLATFDAGVKAAVAAFGAPGAEEKTINLPWGPMPAGMFMGIAVQDQFQHAWDLARATGQSSDLDPELATQLIQSASMMPDQFRGPDGVAPFGAKVDVPDSAPPADRLAGILGREV